MRRKWNVWKCDNLFFFVASSPCQVRKQYKLIYMRPRTTYTDITYIKVHWCECECLTIKEKWLQSDDGDQVAEVQAKYSIHSNSNYIARVPSSIRINYNSLLVYCNHIEMNLATRINTNRKCQTFDEATADQTKLIKLDIVVCTIVPIPQTVYKHMHTHRHTFSTQLISNDREKKTKSNSICFVFIILLFVPH